MPGCGRASGWTPTATTRRSIWRRSTEPSRVVLLPPTSFWPSGTANGGDPSRRCSATTPTELSSGMKRRLAVLCLLAAPFAAHGQSVDWQTVVGPELAFRLEMPAPIEKTAAAEKEKGHASPRLAWSAKRDG